MVTASDSGRIRTIFVRPEARGEVKTVEQARLLEGKGLEGDRYAEGKGSFQKATRSSNLTLIALEDLRHVSQDTGVALSPEESLRNLVTEGVDLTSLLHRRFRIGDAICVGTRLCEPCTVLEDFTGRTGLLRPYVHRTGLRAQVLETGAIRVGDAVEDLGPAEDLMVSLSSPTTGRGVHLRQPDGAYFCGECESPSGNPRGDGSEAICLRCGMRGPILDLDDMPWEASVKVEISEKMRRYPYGLADIARHLNLDREDVNALVEYSRVTLSAALYARVARPESRGLDFDDRFSPAALERLRENVANLAAAREQLGQRLAAAAGPPATSSTTGSRNDSAPVRR
jgi:MOSC domain-containing protein YiiM